MPTSERPPQTLISDPRDAVLGHLDHLVTNQVVCHGNAGDSHRSGVIIVQFIRLGSTPNGLLGSTADPKQCSANVTRWGATRNAGRHSCLPE